MEEISSNDKNDISSRIGNDDFSDFSSKKNINFNAKLKLKHSLNITDYLDKPININRLTNILFKCLNSYKS